MGLGASLEKTNENSKISIRNSLFSVLGRDVEDSVACGLLCSTSEMFGALHSYSDYSRF
jgi:hypothetical protein